MISHIYSSSTKEIFGRRRREEQDSNRTLPTADSEYLAFVRELNVRGISLIIIMPAGRMCGFQYAHLDSDSDFTAECITLRFMGLSPRKVMIHGAI